MNSQVPYYFRKQTQADANAEYEQALDWLQSLVRQTGRFKGYKSVLGKVFQRVSENRTESLPSFISPPDFVETRFEAHALVNIWRQYCSDSSQILKQKLEIVVRGSKLLSAEGGKTEPRDILFELEVGAMLKSWGIPNQLGGLSDVTFEFNGIPVLCECKRPQTPKGLARTLKVADGQLRSAFYGSGCAKNSIGMVAIDISRIVHLDGKGKCRYPETPYGEYLLPSSMITVRSESEFAAAVQERMNSWCDLNIEILHRSFSPRVAGLILCYKAAGVDLYKTGRTVVTDYQRIGWFASATLPEQEFVELFLKSVSKIQDVSDKGG